MGLLDKLRRGKEEKEYEEFREAAVGEQFAPPPRSDFSTPTVPSRSGPVFNERTERIGLPRDAGSRAFGEATRIPEITREESELESPSYSRFSGPTFSKPGEERTTDKFDILQRLDMIEATLSAIRAQTETINERLKTMDMKITQQRPVRTGYF